MRDMTMKAESSLTDRYQTTIPSAVREQLQLGKRDKIAYELQPDGSVSLRRAESSDPVVESFLSFLAEDISANPQNLSSLPPSLAKRIEVLTANVNVDLDSPLSSEDE